jgi:hypothetical protein
MTQISELIKQTMEVGGLTLSDLSYLLGKPRATVFTWAHGRVPRSYVYNYALIRLQYLKDKCVAGCLIPPTTKEKARRNTIESLRHELLRLSEKNPTN